MIYKATKVIWIFDMCGRTGGKSEIFQEVLTDLKLLPDLRSPTLPTGLVVMVPLHFGAS